MKEEEIKNIIFQSLEQIAPDTEPSSLSPDEIIREALDIDSFDYLQFIVSLDENLAINIPEQDYGKISTLRTLIDYILKKKSH